jgi:hypothetical protein
MEATHDAVDQILAALQPSSRRFKLTIRQGPLPRTEEWPPADCERNPDRNKHNPAASPKLIQLG